MLKEAGKLLFFSLTAALTFTVITSCGGKTEKDEAKEAAQTLLDKATSSLSQGDPDIAQTLVDSINNAYPEQIEIRREAMSLQLLINEQVIAREIEEIEKEITQTQTDYTEAIEKMQKVVDNDLNDYYWIAKEGTDLKFIANTGIQARVLDNGDFCIVSEVVDAGNLHHFSVTLTSGEESATSGTVTYDGELNYRINGSETVTYGYEKSKDIGLFASTHPDTGMGLTFNGENGRKRKIKLTAKQVKAIADTYKFSELQKSGQALLAKRELLERKKALAEDQKNRPAKNVE